MPIGAAYLIDTNVLLRIVKPDDRDYALARSAIDQLWANGYNLYYTSQNLAEFWNVCTRPVERNGYGLSISEADRRARLIEGQFVFIEDGQAAHPDWRKLVVGCHVSGAQVHDARLAAVMRVHGITRILTFNGGDFVRYPGIEAIHPRTIGRSA
jgi:predicted nucleic acid-binding protein